MKQPFFSVIIPLYKGEAFLEQCLNSVRNQSFENFECLLINDGSPGISDLNEFSKNQDSNYNHQIDLIDLDPKLQAKKIFDEVTKDDSRFLYLEKENGGKCHTCNLGLEKIRGKYMLLLDNDDWLLPDHLLNFYQGLELAKTKDKYSIVRFLPYEYYNTKKTILDYIPKKVTLANTLHTCTFIAWSLAYDMELMKKSNLQFNENFGPGAKIQSEISIYGGEDYFMAFEYLDAVEKTYGKNNFEIININPNTYKFRELNFTEKQNMNQTKTLPFINYFSRHVLTCNPSWDVWFVAKVLPFWWWLKIHKSNIFFNLFHKFLSLILRLISNCY